MILKVSYLKIQDS